MIFLSWELYKVSHDEFLLDVLRNRSEMEIENELESLFFLKKKNQ